MFGLREERWVRIYPGTYKILSSTNFSVSASTHGILQIYVGKKAPKLKEVKRSEWLLGISQI